MTKALVTGSTGMVGAYLVKELLSRDLFTTIILPFRSDAKKEDLLSFLQSNFSFEELSKKLIWKKGDLEDIVFVNDLFENSLTVFHCAAMVSFQSGDAEKMLSTNVLITENIVNNAVAHKSDYLSFISSIAAIGRAENDKEISEKNEWKKSKNNSVYAISKYESERVVWRGFNEGIKGSIVNPAIILGDYKGSKTSGEIFELARNEFPFYATGSNAFVDVRDVVKAQVDFYTSNITEERFILSEGNHSYKYIFDTIAENLHKKKPKYPVKNWMGQVVLILETIGLLIGRKRKFSKQMLKNSLQDNRYNNQKIFEFLPDFEYTNMEKTIKHFA
jgi:nucleoside-diphosphate-sugar epimerase